MPLVAEAMNRSVVTVTLDAPTVEAVALVRRTGAEHVLVMEDAGLVGILCACDLRGALPGEAVSDRMTVPVLTVRPDAELEDAARTMSDCGVGCLPVAVGGLILGTLSAEELAAAGAQTRPRCRHAHRRAARRH